MSGSGSESVFDGTAGERQNDNLKSRSFLVGCDILRKLLRDRERGVALDPG
jgi:hypothetical protein